MLPHLYILLLDVDECTMFKPCDSTLGICINSPGSFTCTCKDNYMLGANYTCTGTIYNTPAVINFILCDIKIKNSQKKIEL